MKVLITGANGLVGRAAAKNCEFHGDRVKACTHRELDISDFARVEEIFRLEKPEIVLNCAAYTDVDRSESDAKSCYAANSAGVENLARAARRIDSAFVTISTDYVFDGAKDGFYNQRDTPNPLGVYGKAKLDGEIKAKNVYARSIVVRTGWIFGNFGTNFLSVMRRRLEEGKTIQAISDSFGTPTFAVDLARRLRELALLDIPAVYHVTNGGEKASYAEFARKICSIKNFDDSLVESVSADSLVRAAPRPQNSALCCLISEKFGLPPLQSWEQALAEFLDAV